MDEYERFEAWLHQNGAFFEKLELKEYPSSLVEDSNSLNESNNPNNDVEDQEEKKEGLNEMTTTTEMTEDSSLLKDEDANPSTTTTATTTTSSAIRGVFCKSGIAPNTVCMAVPRKCLITVEMGQDTPIGQDILRANLDLDAPKHIFLMIFILQDRLNPNSFFKPYYDVLPQTLSMPIFWSEQDLSYLKGSYLLQQVADRIEAIEEDYHSICEVCPHLADIATLEEFKWARMCVCSRNFGLQIDGIRTSAMVPLADMLNHYRPRETKWTFDDDQQAFTITTLQPMQGGSEIFDSYGQKCNHRFLLNYGFAIEHNVEMDGFCPNEVPLEVELSEDDSLYEEKLEFWCREEAPTCKRVRVCVSNNENTKTLFSLLRVVVADDMEFPILLHGMSTAIAAPNVTMTTTTDSHPTMPQSILRTTAAATASDTSSDHHLCTSSNSSISLGAMRHLSSSGSHRHHLTTTITQAGGTSTSFFVPMGVGYRTSRDVRFPISVRNEIAMLTKLLQLVRYHLAQYPTTLEQDRDALARSTTSSSSNDYNTTYGKPTIRCNNKQQSPPQTSTATTTTTTTTTTNPSYYDNISLPPFSNRRHAVIQVMGEKEVLKYYEDLALTGLDVLQMWIKTTSTTNQQRETEEQTNNNNNEQQLLQHPNEDHPHDNNMMLVGEGVGQGSGNSSSSSSTITTTTNIITSLEQAGKHAQIIKYCTDLIRSLRGFSSTAAVSSGTTVGTTSRYHRH